MALGKRGLLMRDLVGKVPVGRLFAAARDVAGAHETTVRVAILVDRDAPTGAVRALQRLFEPAGDRALLRVEVLTDVPAPIDAVADLVVIVAADSPSLPMLMASAVSTGVPAVVCSVDVEACRRSTSGASFPLEPEDLVEMNGADEFATLGEDLGGWIVDHCHDSRLALASAFPFIRRPLAVEYVHSTAVQNAVIGAIPLIPGADMPLMTLNEGRMILQMAAAYGHPVEPARVPEVAVVILGGFGARQAARVLSRRAPRVTWAVSGTVGWVSTFALGYAMIAYFEAGGMPENLSGAISRGFDSVRGVAPLGGKTTAGSDGGPALDHAANAHPVDGQGDAFPRDAVSDEEI